METKLKSLNGKTVTVIGKRWFDRANGNTYHSTRTYINGEIVGETPFAYGYERQYEQTALIHLKENGYDTTGVHSLYQVKEKGATLVNEVTDVTRKKDL